MRRPEHTVTALDTAAKLALARSPDNTASNAMTEAAKREFLLTGDLTKLHGLIQAPGIASALPISPLVAEAIPGA